MLRYYASPLGGGTGLSPTSTKTREEVQALAQENKTGTDIICYLRGDQGPYTDPFVLSSDDSSDTGKQIRWCKYPGDPDPIFTGGVLITNWTNNAGVWSATTPTGKTTRQFYVNGLRGQRARYKGSCLITVQDDGGSYVCNNAAFPELSRDDCEFVFTDSVNYWRQHRLLVTSVSRVSDVTTFSMSGDYYFLVDPEQCVMGAPVESWPTYPDYIENAFEFLSDPGEWYHNPSTNTIYYIPRSGEDMNTVECWFPIEENILSVSDELSGVEILDIICEYAGWTGPTTQGSFIQDQANCYVTAAESLSQKDERFMRGVTNLPPAAIDIGKLKGSSVHRMIGRHLGGTGLRVGAGSNIWDIKGTVLHDISSNGLQLGDYGHYDEGWTWDTGTIPSAWQTWYGNVLSNHVYDVAIEYLGGVAIHGIAYAETNIQHNELSHAPYTGFSNWTQLAFENYTQNNDISWNKIHDVMQGLRDGGAIYSNALGCKTDIHHNYLYNVGYDGATDFAYLYGEWPTGNSNYYNNVLRLGSGYSYKGYYYTWFTDSDRWITTPGVINVTTNDNYAIGFTPIYYRGTLYGDESYPEDLILVDESPQTAWPQGVTDVISQAGPEQLILTSIIDGEVIAYGFGTNIELTTDHAITVSDYEEDAYGRWRAVLSGVTVENISGISVAASAGIIFDRTGTTEISIWDRTGITPITIKAPPYA